MRDRAPSVRRSIPRQTAPLQRRDTGGAGSDSISIEYYSIFATEQHFAQSAQRTTSFMPRAALITGITGQDGAYLAELLLDKGYIVHGIKRRTSLFNTERIDHLYEDPQVRGRRFVLHYGDLTDSSSLVHVMQQVQPDEVYNLGAQSHVAVSFEEPEYTANSDAMGTLRLLEAIRILGLGGKTRFYQASTSEMFGLVRETPQKETTPFHPRSPYGVAKLYAYWITVNYRESYGIYACNGILFNHESPVRGETFVTRKITRALARIVLGLEECLYLGNLDAKRDWGHAKDYVRAMWLMLQQSSPEDFVIATGEQHSVREFVTMAATEAGVELAWEGADADEVGRVAKVVPGRDRALLRTGSSCASIAAIFARPRWTRCWAMPRTPGRNSAGNRKYAFPNWSRKWCARTCARPSAMPSSSGMGTRCTSATIVRANGSAPRDVVCDLDVFGDDECARMFVPPPVAGRPPLRGRRDKHIAQPDPLNTRCQVQARRRMCGGSLTASTVFQPCLRISSRTFSASS